MRDVLIVIVARRDQKLADDVTVMIHLRMMIQLFRPDFARIPDQCQARKSSGVVKTRSFNNRMYPILVCLRSLVFVEFLAWAYLRSVLWGTRTVKHLCHPDCSVHWQNHFADEGSFFGDTLTAVRRRMISPVYVRKWAGRRWYDNQC